MKKICIYCEKWSSGGIESFLTSLLAHMDITQMQIDVVAAKLEESVFTDQLLSHGISICELSGNRNNIISNRKLFLHLIQEKQYDTLYVNAFHSAVFYYLLLGKKTGIKKRIAHAHNTMLKRGKFYWIKNAVHEWGKMRYAKVATHVWSCSNPAATFMFPQYLVDQVKIIPNGIETEKFRFTQEKRLQARMELGITDQLLVGNIGRLCQQKNQVFLLYIFKQYHDIHLNSKLILVGDGEYKNLLQQRAEQLELQDDVIFTGVTNHPETFLWAMDVFVFPSLFEGLGIVAIEAQAAGLPVICSDHVPSNAILLPSSKQISLNAGHDVWVQAIEDASRIRLPRENCADVVREQGYEIDDVAKIVECLFME